MHHKGSVRVLDVTRKEDHWLTSPARTVLDVAMTRGLEAGIVVADDFIRRGLTSELELWLVYECVKDWPGALLLRLVIQRCDGKAESVRRDAAAVSCSASTSCRCRSPQFEVFRPDGSLAGRTDWAWPEHKVFGEFDGTVKYLRYAQARRDRSLRRCCGEKHDARSELRELTDFRFIRLIWVDLFRGETDCRRVRAKLRRPAA